MEIKDLGEANKILGMNISRDRLKQVLVLHQKDYMIKVLKSFSMPRPARIPISPSMRLSVKQCSSIEAGLEEMESVPYCNVVGSIMYIMLCTRPHLAYAISMASRFMSNLGKIHC